MEQIPWSFVLFGLIAAILVKANLENEKENPKMKKIVLDGRYELGGGMGSWAKSKEVVTINLGDVRLIGGVLMSAYRVERVPWYTLLGDCRDTVTWTPVDRNFNNFDNLRNWMNNVAEA